MIVEIKEYTSRESLILVSEIISVQYYESSNSDSHLAKNQFEFTVRLKDHQDLRFWYNGEKERCKVEYEKVKNALNTFYKKDIIADEIKKYLDSAK